MSRYVDEEQTKGYCATTVVTSAGPALIFVVVASSGMVRLASQMPHAQNYGALLEIGTLTLKTFE